MTEQEFLRRIDDCRAFKEHHLEEGFVDLFRSMGWGGARSAVWRMFDGLIDDGDGDPYMDQYEDAAAALSAIEKAAEGEGTSGEKVAAILTLIENWKGE